jgi:hypothetical protein
MKFTTIALAAAFAMGSTLALAQAGSSNAATDKTVTHTHSGAKNDHRTTGSARSGRNTGDAITTGSDVPYDKPNLSNSPESSDTSQRVK